MTTNVVSGFCHLSVRGGKAVGACLTLVHNMCDSGMIAHKMMRARRGQWQHTLTLFHKMRDTGMTACGISLSVAISACKT